MQKAIKIWFFDCVFQGMVIAFATAELKSIYSTSLRKDGIPGDKVVGRNNIGKRLITYCKMWVHIN